MYRKFLKFKAVYFTLIIFVLIYYFELQILDNFNSSSFKGVLSDLVMINNIANTFGFYVHIVDSCVMSMFKGSLPSTGCEMSSKKYFRFGIDYEQMRGANLEEVTKVIGASGFDIEIFYQETSALHLSQFGSNLPTALILRKSHLHVFHVFYPREDNSWWFGSLASDKQCGFKVKRLLLPNFNCSEEQLYESVLNKFYFTKKKKIDILSHFLLPYDEINFCNELENSHFIECNITRAKIFKNLYSKHIRPSDQRFKHKAWKLLSKAKTVLDLLSIPFWLSSGTCLGYFRECDIIPHSKDVDIGVFASDFNESIITHMELHGLKLKHWFGLVNDSLELSFIDNGGIKLDIFFFYKEGNYLWNGGTQLRTGKKFKYVFPKFNLCWTMFCGLKVRVPCQTEEYIIANYGKNWFIPIEEWDWKTSPNNVHFNGYWPLSMSHTRPS